MSQRYEYKIYRTHSVYRNEEMEKVLEADLNKLAKEGWQFKTILRIENQVYYYLMERYDEEYNAYNNEVSNFITQQQ